MSLQNRLIVHVVLPLRGGKRRFTTTQRASRHIVDSAKRAGRHGPPRLLARDVVVRRRLHDDWPVYELEPAHAAGSIPHLLYLHGGAYVSQIHRRHWLLAARLVRSAPCRCLLPIYPLGGKAGAARVVATATRIGAELIGEAGSAPVVLAGDSAGGGLALAVAQSLRDQELSPARILLISPWLDVATDRPEQAALERGDAMLAIAGLREAGRTYAAGLPLDDPRVSPLCGDLSRLAPITVFTGTRDLLGPDSRRLLEGCRAAGTPCELVEGGGMPHVYPLMPTPEGRAARARMIDLLRRCASETRPPG